MLLDFILNIVIAAKPQSYEAIGPVALGVGAGVLAEAYRFYKGRQQLNKADQYENTKRPVSNVAIPGAVLENTRLAKNSYGVAGLPGQGALENQLDRSVQSGARNLVETGRGADTAAGIAALENSKMMAIEGMGADAAKLKLNKLATLIGTNSELGKYQWDKNQIDWNWNERDPYLQDMAAASAYRNSGEANTFNAISNIASLAGGALLTDSGNTDVNNSPQSPPAIYPDASTPGFINPAGGPFTDATGVGSIDNSQIIEQLKSQYGLSDAQIQQLLASQAPQ